MENKFNFSSKFKLANIFSLILFVTSILFILFKGLNYGIDFKGGTLIELRSPNTSASTIRTLLNNMDLGDVNVKKFGIFYFSLSVLISSAFSLSARASFFLPSAS